ncbi:unnamed protein product [Clonostachys chloroleuca]|uniref:AB hydrolase-1 domain-containing protein n=1 Tax=Clonostachys chloroleuca TaxID=1926264 RepID=A0AA35M1M0_9HYPO|nr:unnamed protein product [Clonostachys chloroleuca]
MSPSAERPTIIACPGAFHDASPYMNSFIKSLKAAGFEAEAHGLTTPGHPENGVTDDEKMMRDAFVPHIEAGKDVVLLVHSYAGFPGCGAVSGYDKKGREARGEKGGLLGVVYIAAFVPQEADSTVSAMLGGGWAPWHVPRLEEGIVGTQNEVETFYSDCDPVEVAEILKTVKPHSLKAFSEPPSALGIKEAGYNGRRAYIRCLQDKALPLPAQDAFVQNSGVEWIVKSMDTSHSPFLAVPDETVQLLAGIIKEFKA